MNQRTFTIIASVIFGVVALFVLHDARLIAATNRSQRHRMGLRREWIIHRVFYSFNFLAIRGHSSGRSPSWLP